jgi:hypothetical protein
MAILSELIENAVTACKETGYGVAEDDYTGNLSVSAEWVDSIDPLFSEICITILENGVVKYSYNDPTTRCEK